MSNDPITRTLYSTDASILEVLPQEVVFPEQTKDFDSILKIAREKHIPITPRGAGTGITGSCLGTGIIVDCSLHLNRILSLNPDQKSATVEPGVVQDQLNSAAHPYGLRLGPDTSTGDRATIGGMIANCSAGSRSLLFGTMKEAVLSIDLLLSTGETITLTSLSEEQWKQKLLLKTQEGEIYRTLEELRIHHADQIVKAFPKLPRRASGYSLQWLLNPFPLNPAQLIAGSEGSLGLIKQAVVKLAPQLKDPVLALLSYPSLEAAFQDTKRLLTYHPISLELIDDKILNAGKSAPAFRHQIPWLKEIPAALLVAEFEREALPANTFSTIVDDPKTMAEIWHMRKMGLGLLLSKRSYARALAFIEDLSIPPEHLAPFMNEFLALLKKNGKEAGIYGHAGPGCLHIRPYVDIRQPKEIDQIKEMMLEVTSLIKKYNGALSGEHGDGIIRSWLNPQLFGKEVYSLFVKVKRAFDPLNLMNPHKVVDPLPFEQHLKISPTKEPTTFFSFKKEGGLALSADLCNGNGACRKMEGTMCPSFQATHQEKDSTRGRANTFRALLRGDFGDTDLSSPELHDVLDLCLQCKGCKTECPSQVDMAKMKSEALYHRHLKKGTFLRERIFAHLGHLSALFFPWRRLINPLMNSFIKKFIGIADKELPRFAEERFSKHFAQIKQPSGTKVALINDTYTEFYCPEVGLAAVSLLNKLGYEVLLPELSCCGRTLLSKGFLPQAKAKALQLIQTLKPYADQEIPLIGLEPSCFFSLKDEYRDFFPEEIEAINSCLYLFDDFLETLRPLPLKPKAPLHLHLHGHCHHKALEGLTKTALLIKSIPQLILHEIPTGCCGMAGSFGYEAEHAHLSHAIGNLKLFPYLEKLPPDALIIANGFSCRAQIASQGRKALHLAEALNLFTE